MVVMVPVVVAVVVRMVELGLVSVVVTMVVDRVFTMEVVHCDVGVVYVQMVLTEVT